MTNTPPLGGYKDVADIVGTTRQNIYVKWTRMKQPTKNPSHENRRSDFPRPYTITADGKPLWNLDEIDEYARRNKKGKYKEPAE